MKRLTVRYANWLWHRRRRAHRRRGRSGRIVEMVTSTGVWTAKAARSACRLMSPRIIHIPLSGGDRKAQAKGIRYAHGIHESAYRESVLIRGAAEAKIREADRLECEAWNAIMWAGGPAP
jgi:hypothetical protein